MVTVFTDQMKRVLVVGPPCFPRRPVVVSTGTDWDVRHVRTEESTTYHGMLPLFLRGDRAGAANDDRGLRMLRHGGERARLGIVRPRAVAIW